MTVMSRSWAMPNADTFSVGPIREFVERWTRDVPGAPCIVDPFARNSEVGSITNDLNPETAAMFHMDAVEFCQMLTTGIADVVIFDPPYSPRQMAEVYQKVGVTGMARSQNARLYREVRDGLDRILKPGGIALSFGWNSAGFGEKRGYERLEVLLVAHGGAHNDTICVAESKRVAAPRTGEH